MKNSRQVKMNHSTKIFLLYVAMAALFGCAVDSGAPHANATKFVYDVDSVYGVAVDSFVLDDKRKATLRKNDRNYFVLKIDGMNPITIGGADSAKIFHHAAVNGATNILIERNEPKCPHRYQMVSVKGNTFNGWPVGSCADVPTVAALDKNRIDYTFTSSRYNVVTNTVYHYANGNVVKDIQTAKVQAAPKLVVASAAPYNSTYSQSAPVKPVQIAFKEKPVTPKPTLLTFKDNDVKPVKIDLKE